MTDKQSCSWQTKMSRSGSALSFKTSGQRFRILSLVFCYQSNVYSCTCTNQLHFWNLPWIKYLQLSTTLNLFFTKTEISMTAPPDYGTESATLSFVVGDWMDGVKRKKNDIKIDYFSLYFTHRIEASIQPANHNPIVHERDRFRALKFTISKHIFTVLRAEYVS